MAHHTESIPVGTDGKGAVESMSLTVDTQPALH